MSADGRRVNIIPCAVALVLIAIGIVVSIAVVVFLLRVMEPRTKPHSSDIEPPSTDASLGPAPGVSEPGSGGGDLSPAALTTSLVRVAGMWGTSPLPPFKGGLSDLELRLAARGTSPMPPFKGGVNANRRGGEIS